MNCSTLATTFPVQYPGIVVTNDGNAILRELDIAHPAAKVNLTCFSMFYYVSYVFFLRFCICDVMDHGLILFLPQAMHFSI